MTDEQRLGFWIGMGGSIIGCTLWIVILGLVLKSVLLVCLPLLIAAACVFATYRLYRINPEKYSTICGVIGFWLVFLNGLLANLYYHDIPETIGKMSTGKHPLALLQVNLVFIGLAALASFFILKDFGRKND